MNPKMMLPDLLAEIEARRVASHPLIIADVLDHILQEITRAHAKVRSGECTYHVNFQTYASLCSRITYLTRMFDHGWLHGQAVIDPGTFLPVVKSFNVEHTLDKALADVRALRGLRYENVCGRCSACRTRRKRWPEDAHFKSEPRSGVRPFDLLTGEISNDLR
jgi:hypothetical protein